MPQVLIASIFRSLIPQLRLMADAGTLLTMEQGLSLERLVELLPETTAGQVYARGFRGVLEIVRTEGGRVTEGLVSVAESIETNLGSTFLRDPSSEEGETTHQILRHFGISSPSSVPVATRLFSPEGGGVVGYCHGRGDTAIVRILRGMRESGESAPLPPLPRHFHIAGHSVNKADDRILPTLLYNVFGLPITLRQVLECFTPEDSEESERNSIRIDTLNIARETDGGVLLHGIFMSASGEFVGNFKTIIDPRPPEGETWVCHAENFHIGEVYRERGLGRALLRSYLKFLFDLGVDALETKAKTNGRYFYPSVGFSPKNRQILEEAKRQFLKYLEDKGLLTEEQTIEIPSINDLGQIADYVIDEKRVGKAFLSTSLTMPLQLRFWLRPDYPGWLRILPDRYPPEWRHLQEETLAEIRNHFDQFAWMMEESLLSDEKEAGLLAERVLNWSVQIGAHLDLMQRSETQNGPVPDDVDQKMRMIADVLNMIEDHSSKGVKYYFRTHLAQGRGRGGRDILSVLDAIRSRGIELRYSL